MKLSDLLKVKLNGRMCEMCYKRKAEVIKYGFTKTTQVYVCRKCAEIVKW